jgi:hypothetical protein
MALKNVTEDSFDQDVLNSDKPRALTDRVPRPLVFAAGLVFFAVGYGGATWKAIGRYWNFGMPCFSYDPAQNTCDSGPTR